MSNWLNSHDWRENIPCPVNSVDLDRWQSELNSIVGVEDDGTERWRFVWGQDMEKAIVWNRYRREWMPRYPAGHTNDYVANPATGVIEVRRVWFGVPRLFAEALIPRVHRNERIERAGMDADGDVFTERRLVGPEYVTLFCITQHDKRVKDNWRFCCLRRIRKGQTCYGKYRPPDQQDIETLREDYHLRVVSKLCRPDEKPTDADKNFFYHAWMLDQMRERQKRDEELDYRRDHILKTVVQWPGTSFDSKKNRFSIPGANN
jgi:hypothetical protein